jgi:uncharacterized membrane protein YeiH
MAAVYTAGGGGEARDSLLATAPFAEARDRTPGVLTFQRALIEREFGPEIWACPPFAR